MDDSTVDAVDLNQLRQWFTMYESTKSALIEEVGRRQSVEAEVFRLRAERDALAAELDEGLHEFNPDDGACIECELPEDDWVHRTSRVVLAEHAEGQ